MPGVSPGTDRMALTAVCGSQTSVANKSELTMHKVDEKQADLLTWIVIGVVFSFVTAALYGPFVWEHWVA